MLLWRLCSQIIAPSMAAEGATGADCQCRCVVGASHVCAPCDVPSVCCEAAVDHAGEAAVGHAC